MSRTRLRLALAAVLLASLTPPTHAQGWSVEMRGTAGLGSSAVDQFGQPFTVTGLSGLAHLGGSSFAAVMDNSDKVVFVDVVVDAAGAIVSAAITGGLTLADSRDFEGIAFSSGTSTVFLAEEGTPAVHEYRLADGAFVRTLATPAVFAARRRNLGFESLARACPSGDLWTANEEALTVDGPRASPSNGTLVRLLRYDAGAAGLPPAGQLAYAVEPMHGPYIGSTGQSGLSELVALPGGGLLALERSLAFASPLFQARIFEVDAAGATDVSGLPGLAGATFTPVAKTLLWSGGANNLEGLTLGAELASGRWSLVGIVDDGDPFSQNAVVAFELVANHDAAPAPPCP